MADIKLNYRTRDQKLNDAKDMDGKYKGWQDELDGRINDLDAFIGRIGASLKKERRIYKWIITRDCETKHLEIFTTMPDDLEVSNNKEYDSANLTPQVKTVITVYDVSTNPSSPGPPK
jgi:hypothetical protein